MISSIQGVPAITIDSLETHLSPRFGISAPAHDFSDYNRKRSCSEITSSVSQCCFLHCTRCTCMCTTCRVLVHSSVEHLLCMQLQADQSVIVKDRWNEEIIYSKMTLTWWNWMRSVMEHLLNRNGSTRGLIWSTCVNWEKDSLEKCCWWKQRYRCTLLGFHFVRVEADMMLYQYDSFVALLSCPVHLLTWWKANKALSCTCKPNIHN